MVGAGCLRFGSGHALPFDTDAYKDECRQSCEEGLYCGKERG